MKYKVLVSTDHFPKFRAFCFEFISLYRVQAVKTGVFKAYVYPVPIAMLWARLPAAHFVFEQDALFHVWQKPTQFVKMSSTCISNRPTMSFWVSPRIISRLLVSMLCSDLDVNHTSVIMRWIPVIMTSVFLSTKIKASPKESGSSLRFSAFWLESSLYSSKLDTCNAFVHVPPWCRIVVFRLLHILW